MTAPTGATGLLAMVGSLIGSGFSAYGAYQGGEAGQAMSNYRARVAQINAGIATEQAGAEEAAGGIRATISGLRTGERMGLTRAGIGAGNLDLGTGSPRRVLSSEAQIGQFEQATITNEAERRAYVSRARAFSDTAESQLDIQAGQQLRTAGDIGAVTSLIGGATSVSDKWTKYTETTGTNGSGSAATIYPDPNNPGGFAPGYA